MSTNDLIRIMVSDYGDTGALADILCNLNSYMHRKQWWGACHASCAALYVALCEAGYQPKLCIGEMLGEGLYFDHSWIELNGYIFDLAISMTLMGGAAASDVYKRQILGKNIDISALRKKYEHVNRVVVRNEDE